MIRIEGKAAMRVRMGQGKVRVSPDFTREFTGPIGSLSFHEMVTNGEIGNVDRSELMGTLPVMLTFENIESVDVVLDRLTWIRNKFLFAAREPKSGAV